MIAVTPVKRSIYFQKNILTQIKKMIHRKKISFTAATRSSNKNSDAKKSKNTKMNGGKFSDFVTGVQYTRGENTTDNSSVETLENNHNHHVQLGVQLKSKIDNLKPRTNTSSVMSCKYNGQEGQVISSIQQMPASNFFNGNGSVNNKVANKSKSIVPLLRSVTSKVGNHISQFP